MRDAETDAPQSESLMVGRRSFLWATAAATALPILSEAEMAHAKLASQMLGVLPPDAVIINANENPLGPCKAACEAITKILPLGGRYDRMGELDALTKEYAARHGLKPENIAFYAGSSEPLHYTTLAFTGNASVARGTGSKRGSRYAPMRFRCSVAMRSISIW